MHLILGDFNSYRFEEESFISQNLFRYKLVETAATHISGALLDHVYVRDDIFENLSFKAIS